MSILNCWRKANGHILSPGKGSTEDRAGARGLMKCCNLVKLFHKACPRGQPLQLCSTRPGDTIHIHWGRDSAPGGGAQQACLPPRLCEAKAQGCGLLLLCTETCDLCLGA